MSPLRRRKLTHRFGDVALGRFEGEDRLHRGIKDRYAFVTIERGGSEIWIRGRTHRVGRGDLVLKQPGEVYRDLRRDGPSTFDVVLIDVAHVASASADREVVFDEPVISSRDPRARPLLALRDALVGPVSVDARDEAIAIAADALASLGIGAEPRPPRERPAITRARAYLRERLAEPIRLDALADHVRLDKYHLIRAFRAEVGMPPYEYLTHLRIARARDLLRTGASPASVALALGYCDQSQLHRHFLRIVGMTPGAYQRRGLQFGTRRGA